MTLLTNHRITAYNKAHMARPRGRTASRTRPMRNSITFNKKRDSTLQILMALPEMKVARAGTNAPPPSSFQTAWPAPSAPPAIMHMRAVHVWDTEYHLDIPEGMDIYEGLRRWYPDLYEAVMEEEGIIRGEPSTPKLTDDEMEAAWAKYDYLEWLSD
jgi:hypothetical protein